MGSLSGAANVALDEGVWPPLALNRRRADPDAIIISPSEPHCKRNPPMGLESKAIQIVRSKNAIFKHFF